MLASGAVASSHVSSSFRLALVLHEQLVRAKASRDGDRVRVSHDVRRKLVAVLLVCVSCMQCASPVHRRTATHANKARGKRYLYDGPFGHPL